MKEHTAIGAEILANSRHELIRMGEVVALSHHEWWNGTGYPMGLRGEDIPLCGRIVALCDVFDALVSERPYKRAWPPDIAFDAVERKAGTQFDPDLVRLFVAHRAEFLQIRNEPPDANGRSRSNGPDTPGGR